MPSRVPTAADSSLVSYEETGGDCAWGRLILENNGSCKASQFPIARLVRDNIAGPLEAQLINAQAMWYKVSIYIDIPLPLHFPPSWFRSSLQLTGNNRTESCRCLQTSWIKICA